MSDTSRPTLYRLTEVGEILGLHPATVNRMVRRGELPALKVGRYWRVSDDQLRSYIEERKEASNPDRP